MTDPAGARKRLSIFGATGSVGLSTLEVVAEHPEHFVVDVLTAHRDVAGLARLARRFRPRLAVMAEASRGAALAEALEGEGIEVAAGRAALLEAAARPVDLVMLAIVGAAGLEPALAALRSGAAVALANKECLVCAGSLFMEEARRRGTTILPVDSEHNAIFQVLAGSRGQDLERIVLTASGGPFRELSREQMAEVLPAAALSHPNWRMGAKITIDSATMMNKGLEVIEARHLFGLPGSAIEVVVHPQSVVHGLVQFRDGSMLAQLGPPDMRVPIAVVLAWPERIASRVERLDLVALGRLDFEAPDPDRFPCLRLAREAMEQGGAAPAVLNAANEVAVAAFLEERIGFLDIARVVESALASPLADIMVTRIEDILAVDRETRALAAELCRHQPSRKAPGARTCPSSN